VFDGHGEARPQFRRLQTAHKRGFCAGTHRGLPRLGKALLTDEAKRPRSAGSEGAFRADGISTGFEDFARSAGRGVRTERNEGRVR